VSRHRTAQRGIALLTALMILALAALFAFSLLAQSQLALDRAGGNQRSAQSRALAQGLFDYALIALVQDRDQGGATDHRGEPWAQPLPAFPVPQGQLTGRLEDLDGRLDLNGFADSKRVAFTRNTLTRLLQILGRDPRLAARIEDAIDADDTDSGGGEDVDFLGARPSTRAPNRALTHLSELRAIPGMGASDWAALSPFVCVLPAIPAGTTERGLNINTARWQLLQSLDASIDEGLAKKIYSEGKANFADINSLIVLITQGGGSNLADVQPFLVTRSSFFLARARIRLELVDYSYVALIDRNEGVLWRAQSPE
jgi:general secretion pathway protein K